MKKFILIFLLLVTSLASNAQHVSESDTISDFSPYEYYHSSSFLTHDFNYDLQLRQKRLNQFASNISKVTNLLYLTEILGGAVLTSISGWNAAVTIPIATGAAICTLIGGNYVSNKVTNRAISIYSDTDGNSPSLSLEQMTDSLQIRVRQYAAKYGINTKEYAECLMYCAMKCCQYGDNSQALCLSKKSQKLFRGYGNGPFAGRDSIQQIFFLDLKSQLKHNEGNDYQALRYARKATELKRSVFGNDSEIYLQGLLDVSQLYSERLKFGKSFFYHKTANTPYVEKIKSEFCSRSESERTAYWSQASKYINRTIKLAYQSSRKHTRKNGNISAAAYDAMLLSKGILLNTRIEFENHIIESGNEMAIKHLQEKKALSDRHVPQFILDSLDYVIMDDLRNKGQHFSIKHLDTKWTDVKNALTDDDLAIEFMRTPSGEYSAILLKRNWKNPRAIRLQNIVKYNGSYSLLDELLNNDLLEKDYYSPEDAQLLWTLSRAIWTDEIIKYFPKTKEGKVFFSPDGRLHITGIESFPFLRPVSNGNNLSEYYTISNLYKVYRVTSTRKLVSPSSSLGCDAAVYGGLDYNLSVDNTKNDRILHNPTPSTAKHQRGAINNFEELPGTLQEALSITKLINDSQQDSLHATSYIQDQGTEESFRELTNSHPLLIHIGTHGYYERSENGDNLSLENMGLCFAGANNRFDVTENTQDGILTAKEASSMNLNGLSLLTLSACESGLGTISSDGVFGLQRGFKIAGVNSILMSLWKVDDEATCKLMTEFYSNWITRKMTKYDALEAAKKTVRETKGWEDPKYWAAFILLDGLD